MGKLVITFLVLLVTLLSGCGILKPISPAQNAKYLLSAEAEAAWIMSAQIGNGAVLLHPNGTGVMPYFSNLALQAVLQATREYDADVKKYLTWYIANINDPDNLGVSGTIYDFSYSGGVLTPLNDYDSSDSYAATFLSLLNGYLIKTNDQQFVLNNLSTIELIAAAIDATAQSDGLTYAKANYHVKYLMDNVEVWRGYVDFASVLQTIGSTKESLYLSKANQIKYAIENQMWNSAGNEYYYYAGDDEVDWGTFYPDATANLWPIIFGFSDSAARDQQLFNRFINAQPSWEALETSEFAWASVGLAAAITGNNELLLRYEHALQDKFFPNRSYPWYISDAGWRIRYLLELCASSAN